MPRSAVETPYSEQRRSYRLGVANGILFAVGAAFIDPVTVLPTFVSRLTSSEVAIGLVSAIGTSGWFLPQLFAASYLQDRPYKRPLYIFSAFLRGAGSLLMAPAALALAPGHPVAALVAFFLCYSMYSFGGGLSGVAFLDIVAKTVPGARLGAFFGNRQFFGSLGAMGCGLVVRAVLGEKGIAFPASYAILFGLAFCCFAPGWALFAIVREPPGRVGQARPFFHFLRGAPEALARHRAYRLLLLSRVLLGGASVALPFYIIYCRRVLGVPESAVGTYLSVQMAGNLVAIPVWASLNDRRGPGALVRAVALLSVVIPALALVASLLPARDGLARVAFGMLFFVLAAAGAGGFMGFTNYLLAIAPEEQRPLYIGVMNTLFAVTNFFPMLGGAIVRHASFQVLFTLAAFFALGGLLAALCLPAADESSQA